MNDSQIPVSELLAIIGQKELEIHLLRKALAQLQRPNPGESQTPSDPTPLAHHPA